MTELWLLQIEAEVEEDWPVPVAFRRREDAERALIDYVEINRDQWVRPEYRDRLPTPDIEEIFSSDEVIFSLTPAVLAE